MKFCLEQKPLQKYVTTWNENTNTLRRRKYQLVVSGNLQKVRRMGWREDYVYEPEMENHPFCLFFFRSHEDPTMCLLIKINPLSNISKWKRIS